MESLWFIIGILATWRFTYMLQEETGPFAVFSRLRAFVARMKYEDGSFSDGFFCFYCLSVWVAIPISALVGVENVAEFVTGVLALSTGALFVNIAHDALNSDK